MNEQATGYRMFAFRQSAIVLMVSLLIPCLSPRMALAGRLIVTYESTPGVFPIVDAGEAFTSIYTDPNDMQPVGIAAHMLADDVNRVTGKMPPLITSLDGKEDRIILVGTLGHCRAIDELVAGKKLDVTEISSRRESYLLHIVNHPFPGIQTALVIVGSDRRGAAYGVTTLSAKMGVSPWYWWANVPIVHHELLFVSADRYTDGPPKVRYRGIFLNDEAPSMSGWAAERFGGFNSKMYVHVFELLLRLRANYLWPAMWGEAFNEDDSENPRLADQYGIVMGTSHQEPMMRSQAEWDRSHHGVDWNYAKDPIGLETFWRDGIRRSKRFENLITIGMRGRNDTPMISGASAQQSMDLLEKIVGQQRNIISQEMRTEAAHVPQVWCLYKEVQSYYEHGLRVPEDVTLLWSDDNWGNLRRLPTPQERDRAGGAGIYYHFDYVGDPRNYKWINTNPITKIWEQMSLADAYGADRIWIANVGDLKPMELPISFFMDMAWKPAAMTLESLSQYGPRWAAQQFGDTHKSEIAELLTWYTRINGRRKPELLTDLPYSITNYNEGQDFLSECQRMSSKAEEIGKLLPADAQDSYFQLVQYPVQATATINELYIQTALNQLYLPQGNKSADAAADEVKRLFNVDAELSDRYNHKISNGFWNHMMDQTHIGYTNWQQPPVNVMPAVRKTHPTSAPTLYPKTDVNRPAPVPEMSPPQDLDGFAEGGGVVSMAADHYFREVDAADASHWQRVDDLGRTGSAMIVMPRIAVDETTDGTQTPGAILEYRLWLAHSGLVNVVTTISPTQGFVPGRGMRYAITFDDQPMRTIDTIAGQTRESWEKSVSDEARLCTSTHNLSMPGYHTLKIQSVDRGIVLQKIVVDLGGLLPSYLGPPESFHRNTH